MTHYQRVSRSEYTVIECAVGLGIKVYVLVFVLQVYILSTRCNKDDVM